MKKLLITAMLVGTSFSTLAADNQCLETKYDAYVDASIHWYEDLVQLTTEQYPDLAEVGNWFLEGRKNHFELNRAAVHYYLQNEPTKVATERSVESWLQLEQHDVKVLAQRDDELGRAAAKSFSDRQAKPHDNNYDLRSAFADLLSHPKKIDEALNKYNTAIKKVEATDCR
ncbi:hypothetical protein [Vibrio hangzhouensis]|uniref:DUF4034 domain-containing protein n=1 Tax=Vibrio hangzhouensis TaxID=462991 RepID=A0A1H6CA30_9VIBR|nr:hypothetical protein [Vibrio hangzhouensis]SEG69226.1 hypothetical protein SAMN04488244_1339 [Vibrio hangzhouensis]